MSGLYVLAGINHFAQPKFYLKIIPPFLPFPKMINWGTGLLEVGLGIMLLFPGYQSLAAWGIIALLIAVFPANIYHFMKGYRKKKVVAVLAIRLPFQFVLIWWAYGFV